MIYDSDLYLMNNYNLAYKPTLWSVMLAQFYTTTSIGDLMTRSIQPRKCVIPLRWTLMRVSPGFDHGYATV